MGAALPPRTRAAAPKQHADVVRALPELALIADPELRRVTGEIWLEAWRESKWARLEDAAKSPHLPQSLGLVRHTRGVVRQSLAAAETARETHGVDYKRDFLVAGALLHDVSKLIEWEPGPLGPVQSARGRLLQHAVYAAHKALVKGVPDEVVHIVVSHTEQSGLAPQTWECKLVKSADLVDGAALERAAAEAGSE